MATYEIRPDINAAANELEIAFDNYEWFYTTRVEGNSICVYVSKMDSDVMRIVPDSFLGYAVKLGFESYLTCGDKYGKKPMSLDLLARLENAE